MIEKINENTIMLYILKNRDKYYLDKKGDIYNESYFEKFKDKQNRVKINKKDFQFEINKIDKMTITIKDKDKYINYTVRLYDANIDKYNKPVLPKYVNDYYIPIVLYTSIKTISGNEINRLVEFNKNIEYNGPEINLSEKYDYDINKHVYFFDNTNNCLYAIKNDKLQKIIYAYDDSISKLIFESDLTDYTKYGYEFIHEFYLDDSNKIYVKVDETNLYIEFKQQKVTQNGYGDKSQQSMPSIQKQIFFKNISDHFVYFSDSSSESIESMGSDGPPGWRNSTNGVVNGQNRFLPTVGDDFPSLSKFLKGETEVPLKETYQLEFKNVKGDGACFYRAVYGFAKHYGFLEKLYQIVEQKYNETSKTEEEQKEEETKWVQDIKNLIGESVLNPDKNALIYELAHVYFTMIYEYYPNNDNDINDLFANNKLKIDTWFYDMLPDWIKSTYTDKIKITTLFQNKEHFTTEICKLCAARIKDIKIYAMQFDVDLMKHLLYQYDITLFVSSNPQETEDDIKRYNSAEDTGLLYLPDDQKDFNIQVSDVKLIDPQKKQSVYPKSSSTKINIILITYYNKIFYLIHKDYLKYDSNTTLNLTHNSESESLFYFDFGINNNNHLLFAKMGTDINYTFNNNNKLYGISSQTLTGFKESLTQLMNDEKLNNRNKDEKIFIKDMILDLTRHNELESSISYKTTLTKIKDTRQKTMQKSSTSTTVAKLPPLKKTDREKEGLDHNARALASASDSASARASNSASAPAPNRAPASAPNRAPASARASNSAPAPNRAPARAPIRASASDSAPASAPARAPAYPDPATNLKRNPCVVNGGVGIDNICIYIKLMPFKYTGEDGKSFSVRGNHYNYIIFNKVQVVGGRNKKNQREKIFMYGKFYTKYHDKQKKKHYIRRKGERKYLPNPKKTMVESKSKPVKRVVTKAPKKVTRPTQAKIKNPIVSKTNKAGKPKM
ncbi:hypothetical protein [Flavobacterium sp.]|jgi:hypothetical protein|uniref:hypothetical protein n=1 Tax=Flavobacterium sp. TaxID=239 RepID=UPI0037C15998